MVVLEQFGGAREGEHVAGRVLGSFRDDFQLEHTPHVLNASIGISLFPEHGEDAETLLKNADIAMYSVKTGGKGNFRFFEPHFYGAIRSRLESSSSWCITSRARAWPQARLQKLRFDVLKIDRAFVLRIEHAEGNTLIAAMIAMAHGLGMRVVAEGVENQRQMQLLRTLGCDEGQAYFFSRPLPPGETPVHVIWRDHACTKQCCIVTLQNGISSEKIARKE